MEYFKIENGKVQKLTKEEHEKRKGTPVHELVKDMTPEELERFRRERYEKFIKPLMGHNVAELKRKRG
ncbi:hypothetical protein ACW2QC_13375 [Virgibacillus sp. FSP13]